MTMNKTFWAHLLRAGLKFSFDLGLSLSALFRPKFISFTEVLLSWVTGTKDMSSAVCFICLNESPLKMMKNAFYFISKVLFVLKIFKFLSRAFGHVGKTAWLERQSKLQNSWRHNLICK